jgi:NADH dehydrogenase [ubiquinone] 1 alpha subcomplex assembly factor 7
MMFPTPPDVKTSPLAEKLAAQIARDGPMSVHDYMAACLYDTDFGYYRKNSPLGSAGDFVTAPEISQVFGEMIGLWCAEVWRLMGEPNPLRIVELGPGRGTLMADALRAMRVAPALLDSATVHLIEISGPLRKIQEQTLSSHPCAIGHHASLSDVPEGATIVIANEFFDCLPVRQFVYDGRSGTWRERMVTFDQGRFAFATSPTPHVLSRDGEDGDIIEVRPGATTLLEDVAARAVSAPLAALIVDYGYCRPSRGDTVQAVKGHRFAHVLGSPGEADVTAHVDFSALVSGASDNGLTAFGPMPLGEWLLRLGLEARASQLLAKASPDEARQVTAGIARLVDPSQMGVLFSVLALSRGLSEAPPPFV